MTELKFKLLGTHQPHISGCLQGKQGKRRHKSLRTPNCAQDHPKLANKILSVWTLDTDRPMFKSLFHRLSAVWSWARNWLSSETQLTQRCLEEQRSRVQTTYHPHTEQPPSKQSHYFQSSFYFQNMVPTAPVFHPSIDINNIPIGQERTRIKYVIHTELTAGQPKAGTQIQNFPASSPIISNFQPPLPNSLNRSCSS